MRRPQCPPRLAGKTGHVKEKGPRGRAFGEDPRALGAGTAGQPAGRVLSLGTRGAGLQEQPGAELSAEGPGALRVQAGSPHRPCATSHEVLGTRSQGSRGPLVQASAPAALRVPVVRPRHAQTTAAPWSRDRSYLLGGEHTQGAAVLPHGHTHLRQQGFPGGQSRGWLRHQEAAGPASRPPAP